MWAGMSSGSRGAKRSPSGATAGATGSGSGAHRPGATWLGFLSAALLRLAGVKHRLRLLGSLGRVLVSARPAPARVPVRARAWAPAAVWLRLRVGSSTGAGSGSTSPGTGPTWLGFRLTGSGSGVDWAPGLDLGSGWGSGWGSGSACSGSG